MAKDGWLARVGGLGGAAYDLFLVEARGYAEDLGRSARLLGKLVVAGAVVFALAFWILGLVLYLGIELLALVVPRWGAVAIVAGVFVAGAAGAAFWARGIFLQLENPADTLRRRMDEHRLWWRGRIAGLAGDANEGGGDA